MAKKPSGSDGAGSSGRRDPADLIPDALREAGKRAAELARNPVARSLLAAALVVVSSRR